MTDEHDHVGYQPKALDREQTIYIAGYRGLAGSAIWRKLESEGFQNLIGRSSRQLDLTDRDAAFEFFRREKQQHVILATAKVGGIRANSTSPVDFLSDNLRIQGNAIYAYAIAQIVGIVQIQAVRRQYGLPWISAMPTNLHGPGDNFSRAGSHILPALIPHYGRQSVSAGTMMVSEVLAVTA